MQWPKIIFCTEDDILYNSNDEVEPDWNPYDDGIWDESCDLYEKLLEINSDDCE